MNVVEIKKRKLILIRVLFYIVFCLATTYSLAQENKKSFWETEREFLKYEKTKKYKGPEDWYGAYPSSLKERSINTSPFQNGNTTLKYNPQQIQKDRSKRLQGFDRGGGKGSLKFDPKVERPDPIEFPDIDVPDVDAPDINLNVNAPTINPMFWKILLFLLIFTIVIIVAYVYLKNKKPTNKKVITDEEDAWNPETVTKTELELRLEEAINQENYRECVRIYFTFILKELIRKNWIQWKREKTNHDYVIEMTRKKDALSFISCVRIYDLVWYGEYKIDEDVYFLLKPELENYYKSLKPKDE